MKKRNPLIVIAEVFRRNPRITMLYGVLLLVALLPVLVIAYLVVRYSVNVPWWDQLSFVDLMEKFHKGTLNFYDLWQQHNEHRLVFPQTIELVFGSLTGYNFRVPVFLSLATVTGSFTLLIDLLRQTFRNSRLWVWLTVPFAWLLFTPFQYVNWIWGFQFAFFLTGLLTILGVWLLTRERLTRKLFIMALLLRPLRLTAMGTGCSYG
jgi:hypothetical protein